jgi:hypothetical protein
MTSQAMGHRVLVLGAGVLLIGSLGVGSASATSYTNSNCVEVSSHGHPNRDGTSDDDTDNATDTTDTDSTDTDSTDTDSTDTDSPLDPLDNPLDPLDNPLDPLDDPTDPLDNPTDPLDNPTDPLDPLGGGLESGTGGTGGSGGSGSAGGSGGAGAAPISPSVGSPSVTSGGAPSATSSGSTQGLRAAAPNADPTTDDSDLDEGPNSLTTTDQGEGYDSGYDYDYYRSHYSNDSSTTCYYNYSVGHYWYDDRPVGEVHATQVKRVPRGGVDTGN